MHFGITNPRSSRMKIAVLPGDDIGPEITRASVTVLTEAISKFGLEVELETHAVGMAAHRECGTTLPAHVMDTIAKADGVILGPCGMTEYPSREAGGINVPGTIRKQFELYANIRPARSRAGVPNAREGLDVVVVRENTEGFYSDRNMFSGIGEFMPTPDCALSVRKITAHASNRIARAAFEYAAQRKGEVTIVGKRHVLQLTDGIFVGEAEKVAKDFPGVKLREMDIDAMAAEIYSRPQRYDVILITNMFGDILSNEAAALSGGLGLAAALNAGDRIAAANAGHGSAPDIAGRGIANPSGLMLSVALLLDWIGRRNQRESWRQASRAMQAAMDGALADPKARTGDLGGSGNTQGFADAVCARLAQS